MSHTMMSVMFALLVAVALARIPEPWPNNQSPLTDYVHHIPSLSDWVYNWTQHPTVIRSTFLGQGYTGYNIWLTSQTWLSWDESNNPVWTHWLQVAVPDNLTKTDLSAIYITGGSNSAFNTPPSSINEAAVALACLTNTPVAALLQVPNEPITFLSDPTHKRTEDAFIAYTWGHFINNTLEGDWLARCPMTKSVIKAMDAVQQWAPTVKLPNIERFVIAGASKRGWTTWMVGAVGDPRVIAIAPIVAPIANLIPQINEMWQSYGEWSFALQDYVNMYLMGWLNLPVFDKLLRIIDPLAYPEPISRIPKYVVMSTGDEFFMPDSAKWFWDQLPGRKYLMMVPNAEHSLAGHAWDVIGSMAQFYRTFIDNEKTHKVPEYSFEVTNEGQTITVTVDSTANVTAHVYHSRNNAKRDWRLITCSQKSPKCVNLALWSFEKLTQVRPGVYEYTLPLPTTGHWSAFFIQMEVNLWGSDITMKLDSRMSIIPENMPYQPCPKDVCQCGYSCNCVFNCTGTPNAPAPPTFDLVL